ncbi:MAG: FeoA family protein [Pseudomonadota bacterium]
MTSSSHTLPQLLADAATGDVFTVVQVSAPAATPEWALQLEDIGFLPGERVAIMARGLPGGDPLVVRVGLSTFALRRDEAACIQVRPLLASSAATATAAVAGAAS